VVVLFSVVGVPSEELFSFSASGPEFLEDLLLTSSSLSLSFGIFFVTMLRNNTSFISCWSSCAFLVSHYLP
jgi:hypothetical protein